MQKAALFLQVLFFVAFASHAYDDQSLPIPGNLNYESVMTSQRLSSYDTIVIKDYSTDEVA
jgi:hypothetical protein